MADKTSLEIGIAAAIILLAALVYLMYLEAIKPDWSEISQAERKARKEKEAKK